MSVPPKETTFKFGSWDIVTRKSHILQSKCKDPQHCEEQRAKGSDTNLCTFCRFQKELTLPQLPDMVFGDNCLRIMHGDVGIEFNPLDALKLVNPTQDILKVAVADAWREARADSAYIGDVIKPFDWTFTTTFKGTVIGSEVRVKVSPTTERIDIEKLKQKEQILFYDDLLLLEDELADNGCAILSVKIRVMPSGYFVLQRFYLRVDNVLIRVHDTRIHHQVNTNYMIREFSVRENTMNNLQNLSPSIITDPNEICTYLKLQQEEIEKLEFC